MSARKGVPNVKSRHLPPPRKTPTQIFTMWGALFLLMKGLCRGTSFSLGGMDLFHHVGDFFLILVESFFALAPFYKNFCASTCTIAKYVVRQNFAALR